MIGAVVVHHIEDRDAMMRGRPQRAGHEHQVAIALDRNADPSVPLVGERGARRGWRGVTDAGAARATPPSDSRESSPGGRSFYLRH